jgi:hypothetical protein
MKPSDQYMQALDVAVVVVAEFEKQHGREPTEVERTIATSLFIELNKERRGQAAQAARTQKYGDVVGKRSGGGRKSQNNDEPPKYSENVLGWSIKFGKHKGTTFRDLLDDEPEYVRWLLDQGNLRNKDLAYTLEQELASENAEEPDFSNAGLTREDDLPF